MQIAKDCHRLPNLEQFKRICTLSLICATLQSKFPNHGKSCFLISDSLSLFCFLMEKGVDVENQKSTVLTDAPAEVQPCEGWCFPVGERDWQPWQPWPQVVYIFIHEPTATKAWRANCPLLSQNRLRAVMMRATLQAKRFHELVQSSSPCQNHQKQKFFFFKK